MKRFVSVTLTFVWLLVILYVSWQPSSQQDLKPVIMRQEKLLELIKDFPPIQFHYHNRLIHSHENTVGFVHFMLRKTGHFTAYAILGTLMIISTGGFKNLKFRRWMTIGIVVYLVALADEYNQLSIPDRTGCWADTLIDLSGYVMVSLGLVFCIKIKNSFCHICQLISGIQ
ncbi:MAG: VanZ family protein [Syntrophomonadaceae bacterium]|jgi:VanZ family protein